jgi:predicted CxxxxCH...CXXCH cytochrome family protein
MMRYIPTEDRCSSVYCQFDGGVVDAVTWGWQKANTRQQLFFFAYVD